MLMPDNYSVDLDQFQGLYQAGATDLSDQVNNQYLQIFGASIAGGVISGAAEATIFGFDKARYRGLKKNHRRLRACFALGNLYPHRKRLVPLRA